MSVSPRAKYREQMYEVAYPDLWKKIATKIGEDQSKKYSQKFAALQNRCGSHLDQAPEVGLLRSEFIACRSAQI